MGEYTGTLISAQEPAPEKRSDSLLEFFLSMVETTVWRRFDVFRFRVLSPG